MQKPVLLRKCRQRVKSCANWSMFCYQFHKDHLKPDLIWNHRTREELKDALDGELRALDCARELAMNVPISWNHAEFEASPSEWLSWLLVDSLFQVRYDSLLDEVKIGDYYLRILLDEDQQGQIGTEIHNPCNFFNDVYHRFLLSAKSEMRCLCLRAMTITYSRHSTLIGPFVDCRFLIAMLAKCANFAERDHLLLLISKLTLNRANVRELLAAQIVPLLINLATLAHLHLSRAHVPSHQTNVLESSSNSNNVGSLEWYHSDKDGKKKGPFSFVQLKQQYKDKLIWDKTQVWAQGLDGWTALSSVPQLKWTMTATGTPVMNQSQLCVTVLDIFIRMCSYFPSRDDNDCVIHPVPKVKQLLTRPDCLPHIVQLLLTFDPTIVERVATLLHLVVQDSPLASRLYLSGVFFFILMYNGSNVLPIARFLHYTHARQAFSSSVSKSKSTRHSVLSPLLPDAAIYYLDNYGPDKYAQVFLGEFDNPEIIWNAEMRRQLIEKLAVHVADFSCRLLSNIKAPYRYCPIPGIVYPKLVDELFCHIYYLRNLCDSNRFSNWPIRDPIEFIRACLATWNEEIEKKPPSMSVEEACQLLNITLDKASESESAIRKAYFKLAQKFHPDKNPDGREMFEQINAAYELLCAIACQSINCSSSSPTTAQRIVLCLRAQSIVYRRNAFELEPYKYAGYTQLVRTIQLEIDDAALFSSDAVPLLEAAVELCQLTLQCSALNAEQLRREGGLEALRDSFDRCSTVIGRSLQWNDLAVVVCVHVCRCFVTAAHFESCREKISHMPSVFADLCHVLHFDHLVELSCSAANCVSSFAVCTLLQTQLFQSGVLWKLLPNLFRYDYTLDEGGVDQTEVQGVDQTEVQGEQAGLNRLARASCHACAALSGYGGLRDETLATPNNDGVENSLKAMLSPFIVKALRTESIDFVLKTLNCNSESPLLIWDNSTRNELLEFVELHRTSNLNTSQLFGAEFRFSIFTNELIIGDVFVRIYNQQANFPLPEPKRFCMDLLDFLARYVSGVDEFQSGPVDGNDVKVSVQSIEMVLEALRNVIEANLGLEILCIGWFKLLFKMLNHRTFGVRTLQVISLAIVNQQCVADIAASGVICHLLLFMGQKVPAATEMTLDILGTLASNATIVKETLEFGGLLYLLELFCCCSSDTGVRTKSVEVMARMQADKLTGPRWTRLIGRFLPPLFAQAARDSPLISVSLFDGSNENPELIWNAATRRRVQEVVKNAVQELRAKQKIDSRVVWQPPSEDSWAYEQTIANELVIADVFVRLFIANPGWTLRQPHRFAVELVDNTLEAMRTNNETLLDTLSTALVALIANQPNTADRLAAQGYLPQFCRTISSSNPAIGRASILIFRQLAGNRNCADELAHLDWMAGLKTAMDCHPELMHEAATSVHDLFSVVDSSDLIDRAISCQFVQYLVNLLGQSLTRVANEQAVKAQLVRTLKAMTLNLEHGHKVTDVLNKSKVWAQFKDQRHDLFLAPTQQLGAITVPEPLNFSFKPSKVELIQKTTQKTVLSDYNTVSKINLFFGTLSKTVGKIESSSQKLDSSGRNRESSETSDANVGKYIPDAHFEPVIPLSNFVVVNTGEEGEQVFTENSEAKPEQTVDNKDESVEKVSNGKANAGEMAWKFGNTPEFKLAGTKVDRKHRESAEDEGVH